MTYLSLVIIIIVFSLSFSGISCGHCIILGHVKHVDEDDDDDDVSSSSFFAWRACIFNTKFSGRILFSLVSCV